MNARDLNSNVPYDYRALQFKPLYSDTEWNHDTHAWMVHPGTDTVYSRNTLLKALGAYFHEISARCSLYEEALRNAHQRLARLESHKLLHVEARLDAIERHLTQVEGSGAHTPLRPARLRPNRSIGTGKQHASLKDTTSKHAVKCK
jgi:hypothetical protein